MLYHDANDPRTSPLTRRLCGANSAIGTGHGRHAMRAAKPEAKGKSAQQARPVFATKAPLPKVDTRAISKSVMERTKKTRSYLAK
jgi:hypothetical protein